MPLHLFEASSGSRLGTRSRFWSAMGAEWEPIREMDSSLGSGLGSELGASFRTLTSIAPAGSPTQETADVPNPLFDPLRCSDP
jgi:hypothetical protein